MCSSDPSITVKALDVTYNRTNRLLTFDVAGSSAEAQKVILNLVVSAYGQDVYTQEFNPCDGNSTIAQYTDSAAAEAAAISNMCPIPAGTFSSQGQQTVPQEYASKIPAIAFNIPDLDGLVKLEVKSEDGSTNLACIQSTISNGHTVNIPAVQYAAAGVAAAALGLSAIGALASGGHPGASSSSPTFGEVIGWFQGMATNGMLSVAYPKVYQSFTTNFAFSTGLVPWGSVQTGIDNFRAATGGNLTDDSYQYLKNATLVFSQGSSSSSASKRALKRALLWLRDGTTINVNGTEATTGDGAGNATTHHDSDNKEQHFVKGMQAYVEQLTIPQANTFMTVLLVWACIVAAIIVLILLTKAILEAWAQCGKLSKGLESWRKRYWWRMAKALTNLVLLLYGVWTMYCIYQFTNGDSWAAKLLAAITLALFTAVLAGFTFKIYQKAHEFKKMEGAADKLYEDKEVWIRYSLFYDNYKKSYWWIFVPTIVYMFARGAIIAGGNGHGMIQCCGQLIVEGLMLCFLLWTRPWQRRSGRWINLTIQTVRVISVVCVLVFVEELGISQTTKTITGVVLIVVQCVLTGILAILIAINAIITCVKENPHTAKRREAAKLRHDNGSGIDNLTPLDARNSLLMGEISHHDTAYKAPLAATTPFYADHARGRPDSPYSHYDDREYRDEEHLVAGAAPLGSGHYRDHSRSPSVESREPRLPDLNFSSGPPFGRAL